MSRIEPAHLARRHCLCAPIHRRSESQRRQYGLVGRARQLGWTDVSVIRVGAVVSIEASRLARNGRDWHTLLEFCGLVGTLIVDEDGISQ